MAEHPLAGTSPSKIVAVHVSYRSRAMERGALPQWPSYFLKPPSHAGRRRRSGAQAARVRAARLRGRGRARHRDQGRPGIRRRRVVACALGDRGQRLRRLRPALRRQGLQRPFQGRRRVHPARPGAARRPARRPGAGHAADLGQRRARAGRGQRRRPAVLLRRHRRRHLPADHARAGRRDPHRHPDRLHGGSPRRPGRGRGERGDARRRPAINRPAALADRRGRLRAQPAGRDAERRRRPARGRLRQPRRPRPGRSARRPAGRAVQGRHRHARRPAPQARLQPRHPRPAADDPAEPEDGRVRPDAALCAVPRGPVRRVRHHRGRHRAERPEARRRAGQAGRDPGHRGAR